MAKQTPEARLNVLTLAIECDREGLQPEQVLRRIGLHGFDEVDLEVAVAEFNHQVEKLRGYFAEQKRNAAGLV